MKTEKPIPFSGPMACAILDGKKTQTRRLSDRYNVGDVLWVREDLMRVGESCAAYSSNHALISPALAWRWRGSKLPAMFMPRCAARIFLKVASKKQERLLDITEADAIAEGFSSRDEFLNFWDMLYKNKTEARSHNNPIVWPIEFYLLNPISHTTQQDEI